MKKRLKAYKQNFKPLTKYLKKMLGTKVSRVVVSQRIEKTPSIIVTSQYGNTANMERIMRAQTFASGDNIRGLAATKTLELNPRHPIIIELNNLVLSAPESQATKDLGNLIYDTALISSGFQQDDVEGYTERMIRTLAKSINLDSLDLAEEIVVEDGDTNSKDDEEVNSHDEF